MATALISVINTATTQKHSALESMACPLREISASAPTPLSSFPKTRSVRTGSTAWWHCVVLLVAPRQVCPRSVSGHSVNFCWSGGHHPLPIKDSPDKHSGTLTHCCQDQRGLT